MKWMQLLVAVVAEVIGTSALKSSQGFNRLGPSIILSLLALAAATAARGQDNSDRAAPGQDGAPVSNSASNQVPALTEAKSRSAEIAKELQNPVAGLISVPIENNWDFGIGPANAMRYRANVMPVIPFSVSTNWNLITRTIVPVIYAESPTVGGRDISGLGDVSQSFFLSPKEPSSAGWVWGAGPVFHWPTATDGALGAGKWGAGPTGVLLKQDGDFTYGMLANHIWSYAGWGNRNVDVTFLQPFFAYTTPGLTVFSISTESGYDWDRSQWIVPLNADIGQLVMFGDLPVQFTLGVKYYAERPAGGPDWGLRFTVTFTFPN